jgi:hypothetical protein
MMPLVDSASLPIRPSMPTTEDEARAVHQLARYRVLTEDWDDILIDWAETRVAKERLAAWGALDTSVDTLADICRQYTTPGLYGTRPTPRNTLGAEGLIGPGGKLDESGYFTLMQWVQYLVTGMGDFLVCHDVKDGALVHRPVEPFNVWIGCDPDRPDRAVHLWELRLRWLHHSGRWVYAWDQYDLGETATQPDGTEVLVRPPSYRVVRAGGADPTGADLSNLYLGKPGGLVGDDYPYRMASGAPFLRYTIYRAVDSKKTWNQFHKRGALRGTLNAALYWTYAGHCARDASGKTVIIGGLEPIGADVIHAGKSDRIRTLQLSPGAILYHAITEGAQAFVQEVGPGSSLPDVLRFAHEYEIKQAVRWGLNPADIQRTSNDPASGAALLISQQGKREFADTVRPLFERADLDAIAKCAALLRIAGVETFPESGYSMSYEPIPESPQEKQARREQADWEVAKGYLSPIGGYQRINPGSTEEDAVAAIVKAEVDKAALSARVAEELAARGLTSAGTAGGGGDDLADTALTGVQIAELKAILLDVSKQQLSPDAAKLLIPKAYPTIPGPEADAMVDAAAAFIPSTPSQE